MHWSKCYGNNIISFSYARNIYDIDENCTMLPYQVIIHEIEHKSSIAIQTFCMIQICLSQIYFIIY